MAVMRSVLYIPGSDLLKLLYKAGIMRTSHLLISGLVGSTMLLCAGSASGQNYPTRVVRILGAEAGGASDMVWRIIAQGIAPSLGQPVIVENHGGGTISPELVAKSAPDGHTLLAYGNTFWLMPLLRSKMSYDPIMDFVPVTLAYRTPLILLVHPSLPVNSVQQLIALAKARPGQLNYSSAAIGTSSHLPAELFKYMAGVDIVRIGYKGHPSALNALIGGEAQVMFANIGPGMMQVKASRAKGLAVTSLQPSPLAPGVPTMAASGLPGYEADLLSGIFAPARTPEAIVNRLNQEIGRLLERPEIKERLLNVGLEALASTPERSAAMIKSEVARLGKVIKQAGIREE